MAVTLLAAVLSASPPASRMKTAAFWLFVLPLVTKGSALRLSPAGIGPHSNNLFGSAGSAAGCGSAASTGAPGAADVTNPAARTPPAIKGTAPCGGGAASVITAPQSGAGTFYGEGEGGAFYRGGGGASLNGHNSGAGGNGGPGFTLTITHFS
jgi:hypothetical protein